MPNRPLVAPHVQSISFDPAAAMQDVASIQINRQRMDEARRKSMASMRMRQLAQQYPDSPLEFVDAVTKEFPEEGFALGESYWKGIKENALAHKAQSESSTANLEVGTRILQAARQNPALYPAAKQWITKMSPEVGAQLSEQYNEAEVDGWLQTGAKTSDFLKAQADAADRLTKQDTRGSVLTLFAGASNPQQWQTAVDLTTRSGLKPLLGLVASEWSPEAQAAAAQASISPEKQAELDKRGSSGTPESQAIAAAEREKGAPLTSAELTALHGRWGKSDDRPRITVNTSTPRPLTQTAESTIISKLSNQWTAATKSTRELDRAVGLMDTGLAAARRGDLAQGAQTILVTFQKLLDPTSVVRESEFDRSAAGQSLMTRAQGAIERLASGGAGVPLSELEKFAALGREMAAAQKSTLGPTRTRIKKTAERYNIPEDLVLEGDSGTGAAPPPPGGSKPRFEIVSVK